MLRVDEAYRNIPWWDSRPILSILVEDVLNIKPRCRSTTAHHDFLSKDEHEIRELGEHAAIFYDHLTVFKRYAQRYSKCLAKYNRAIPLEPSSFPSAAELSSTLEHLRKRLESVYGWDIRNTPPRRMTERLPALLFDNDCAAELPMYSSVAVKYENTSA
ncbi:uncharacterized protein BT62DRAFT_338989 [Guyanagaster necrorhizus]|uniref:Uncharacterized protein n=1 Tax=Guyanagaster necrorhizus TaxID=856835 RepID=A0A9P7VMP5_9AGAR|nr:uncharacterized protein BT62DRAFT_338989 [Guyanagaster necrorhizus MCA 3950]KAG7443277.1 hypothetical protein BT62DRAFT_338989 [Guyanagaster necrorhizus MCA 3950]